MSYLRALTFAIAGIASLSFAQSTDQALTFRKATIGMPLAQFRAAANPRCTDSIARPGSYDPQRNGSRQLWRADSFIFATRSGDEIVCHDYSDAYDDFNVAGAEAKYVIYRFRNDNLYSIEIATPSSNYEATKQWLIELYGPPEPQPQTTFQNGYGAAWKGENLRWDKGEQAILMSEGPGNGPGKPDGSTTVQIVDKAAKVDFAAPGHPNS